MVLDMHTLLIRQIQHEIGDLIYDNIDQVADQVGNALQIPTFGICSEVERWVGNHQYRELPPHIKTDIEAEVKLLLHAQRDCHRNRGKDATKIPYFTPHDEYYCDCIGIMRCLRILGYGEFGAVNAEPSEPPELSAWLRRLEDEVMEEEGFQTDNRCEWCLKRYGKDDKSEKEKRERNEENERFCSALQV